MRILHIPRRIVNLFNYGLLYNWFTTQEQAQVEYGYLYNWWAATDSRNIASAGWHVPTMAEYATLSTQLGGDAIAGGKLKETGITHWDSPNTGADNSSGFNARGAGIRAQDGMFPLSIKRDIWLITSNYQYGGYKLSYNTSLFQLTGIGYADKWGFSIRLIKDATTLTDGQTGTYVGNDGKLYSTICIGTQEWVSADLMETKYRDGSAIPEVTSDASWAALTTGARCSYNNTEANAGSTKRLSSSVDWVVPLQTEYISLITFLGSGNYGNGITFGGGYLKEAGLTFWETPNTGAVNSYLFNARGEGMRANTGAFSVINRESHYWERDTFDGVYHRTALAYNNENVFSGSSSLQAQWGHAIRLLYTGAGTPTEYVGNDGTVYPVVVIGGERWIAQNLKETKWSDGSWIKGFDGGVYIPISNINWTGATEAMTCVYDNNLANI